MGETYDAVVNFEERLHQWTKGLFLEERMIFAEMAELLFEPLEYFPRLLKGEEADRKSVIPMLISRLFNDFEAAKLLILNGLCEQAYMPLRDGLECMGLIRLFDADGELALRWVTKLAEYHPNDVRRRLEELDVDAPEFAFYGFMSTLSHANVLGSVTHVQERDVGNQTLLRTYHFGGYANEKWIGMQLQALLIQMLFALAGPLTQIYKQYVPNIQEWHDKVVALVPRLQKCGIDIGIDWEDMSEEGEDELHPRVKKAILKIEQKLFDMNLINEAEPAEAPLPGSAGGAGPKGR